MTAAGACVRYRFGRFELQVDERRLLADAQPVHLGPHAFDLLVTLAQRSGRLTSKDELLSQVWGKVIVEENTLQVHISALRKVLGADAIATVSGCGYRFALDVARVDASAAAKHNLPQQLTSFIGRERQMAEVRQLLAATRLLTLTGTGGCGKTRLALQLAGSMLEDHPDGVWLVELAQLGDPAMVAQAVAKALGIQEQPGKELVDSLTEWLANRRLLLVLDNAEHMLEACARLADHLLRRCAGLLIVVTSRERLGIAGELTYRVPSLSLPPEAGAATREPALASEAVRLFIDRARLQRPDFEVTDGDTAALASICRRLDGIALAIELAAPRVRMMSLQDLSRRLDDRFAVLTGGSRTALPRHRTLRSLLDWSHELLAEAEKAMLRRASVFAGGWTLEAAQHVCSGAGVERGEVLDLLTSLSDKNLVVPETLADTTRFGLLETVRHYAQDRLRHSGEEASVHDRHVEYFGGIGGKLLDAQQTDAELQAKLLRLDAEHDNLRAALAWCEGTPARSVEGLRLAGELYWFWRMRGHYAEASGWIARLVAIAPDAQREHAHASAFHAVGALAFLQGDSAAAETRQREALAIWRRLGDQRGVIRTLNALGSIVNSRGEHAAAHALFAEALSIARERGDRRNVSMGLHCLGMVAHEAGDDAAAQALLEECVSISRAIGPWRTAVALSELGGVRHAQGDLGTARAMLVEALQAQRESGDRPGIASTLLRLATVMQDGGDLAAAKACLAEALDIAPPGDTPSQVTWLEAFAGLSSELCGGTWAARLWGCAERLREQRNYSMPVPERARQRRLMAAAREALPDDAEFARAWNEGRSWTLDVAVRHARSL